LRYKSEKIALIANSKAPKRMVKNGHQHFFLKNTLRLLMAGMLCSTAL
jgi:hypothetical protein